MAINLKQLNEVVNAALPSIKIKGMQLISYIYDVNGAAILASA